MPSRHLSYALAALLLALCPLNLLAQTKERCVVTFYNVENLFDTIDNPATADEDMHPLADKQWNNERYRQKIASLARVIADMGVDGELPAIVALAEVENRRVVEELALHPSIAKARYGICHFDSPDKRGIDVALLYRPDIFSLEKAEALKVSDNSFSTRDILAISGQLCGEKALLFVNHWPSRIGGTKQTEQRRIACARKLRSAIDEAIKEDCNTKIIVMGDMNDNPSDHSIKRLLGARGTLRKLTPDALYNPLGRGFGIGSSRYEGRWNHFDQILLSANLVGRKRAGIGFDTSQKRDSVAYVFRRDYMCDRRGFPLPTYRGTDYTGGVSDHLPVCVILQQNIGK